MCRMFAVRSSHVVDAARDLIFARHSLLRQSRSDRTQRDHSDGWGIVSYQGEQVRLTRHPEPAYEDPCFDGAIRAARGKTIVAHVRRASRGIRKLENCHPFVFGRWTFAHNGTLTALESMRKPLRREIAAPMRKRILGETDSELMFYWLMQRLIDARAIEGERCLSLSKMRAVVADAIVQLDHKNTKIESKLVTGRTARLNVLLTNGNVLVGTRLRNSLFHLSANRNEPGGLPRRAITIASEPTDKRRWKEIPDASIFSISSQLEWTCHSIQNAIV